MSTTIKWQTLSDRQRDAFIAEHIFDLQIHAEFAQGSETELDYGVYFDKREGIVREIEELPRYTTSMDAAWIVAEQFEIVELSMRIPGEYRCQLKQYCLIAIGVADTPSEAICLAALRLKGFEVQV